MKKGLVLIILIIFYIFVLSTCASVKSRGIEYFIGRSESDLIKHFGYNGEEIESSYSEYDKVTFFTNKVLQYQMSKTNIVRYKVSKPTDLLLLSFNKFSDGCVNFNTSSSHYNGRSIGYATEYGMHYYYDHLIIPDKIIQVYHRNDNSVIIPRINEFNNIINRNSSFPYSQRDEAFNRSYIGDSYYLYSIKSEASFTSGVPLTPSESYTAEGYTAYLYGLWKVDIVAEDKSETDRRIVIRYNERLDHYYDDNGNTIPLDRVNSIISSYTNDGWTFRMITEGNSMLAYIKDGKVIRVEERKNQ